MTSQFRLGGDLTIDRLGLGAMRLPSATGTGPAVTPGPPAPSCAAPSNSE
ncbi:hypothetical protein [Nonomuraea insulae]|uniref:Aldo/keto reductase family protein n=1 Tax=Nonomuraea insulae TaxID=1616787 RepID=A0ABW1DD82_9ACTN